MHLRVLSERLEYLFGVIPVIPIANADARRGWLIFVNRESQRADLLPRDKARAVETLQKFLKYELTRLREPNPFYVAEASGAAYVVNCIEKVLRRFYGRNTRELREQNELDLNSGIEPSCA